MRRGGDGADPVLVATLVGFDRGSQITAFAAFSDRLRGTIVLINLQGD
jgi:hypothetical protein